MAFMPVASAILPAFLGCVLAAMLTGCEKRLSNENIDLANKLQESAQQRKQDWPGVSEGMTKKEVESVLGQPLQVREGIPVQFNQPVSMPTVTYVYQQDGQAIELSFLGGKLQGRIPKFGEKVDSKAPLHMKKTADNAAPATPEAPSSDDGAISVDIGGSKKADKLHSTEFKGALIDKIKREEAAIKALQKKPEEGAQEPKKEQP